jgi:plasmid rolling circle replication initiator protein Rep
MQVGASRYTMQERIAPSRPVRLGTRRRSPRKAATSSASGASCSREPRATSLDTSKQLATTYADILKMSETPKDRWREKLRLHRVLTSSVHEIWQSHARNGEFDVSAKWEKEWLRLTQCQAEWIGYHADCCKGATRPIAVPIGCNHRLCPLCAAHRAENARKKVRKLFDRLTHPVLITLTIPNLTKIRKHDFTLFRKRTRQLLKQHQGWIRGGVYSLETTYNRAEKSWHIHIHILADASHALPTKQEKITFAGQSMYAFTLRKLSLEYDWLRLWSKDWGKKLRVDANSQRKAGEQYKFQQWVEETRKHDTKEFKFFDVAARKYKLRSDLTQLERMRYEAKKAWNKKNRRVIDLKPVSDRDGAAFEVLKYITKVASFSDLPEAIEPFMTAVRGARLIQTFGSWYGVKLEGDANEHDWSEMQCQCGLNQWKRMGVFYRDHVRMDQDGRWRLRDDIAWNDIGTVVKPKIPALAERESG